MSTLSAQASVISVGKNGFGYPDLAVVARWAVVGDVYQTQNAADNALVDGDVTVVTDGISGFTISAEIGTSSSYAVDN